MKGGLDNAVSDNDRLRFRQRTVMHILKNMQIWLVGKCGGADAQRCRGKCVNHKIRGIPAHQLSFVNQVRVLFLSISVRARTNALHGAHSSWTTAGKRILRTRS
jgi:hypothetical protein